MTRCLPAGSLTDFLGFYAEVNTQHGCTRVQLEQSDYDFLKKKTGVGERKVYMDLILPASLPSTSRMDGKRANIVAMAGNCFRYVRARCALPSVLRCPSEEWLEDSFHACKSCLFGSQCADLAMF